MENRNAAIVTIDDYINYGNRLQNYALTKLLQNEGFQVFNGVRVYTKEDWINRTNDEIKKIVKWFVPFGILKGKLYSPQDKSGLKKEREKKFLDFVNAWGVVNGESNLDSFMMGFQLGANFTYDTFVETDTPFQDLLKE